MIKRAHFYWGNTTLPWLQSLSIRSFRHLHPDWEVNVYRPTTPCVYDIAADYWDTIRGCTMHTIDVRAMTGCSLQGYDSTNAWMHTTWSDALRNHLLFTVGGLWSDVDVLWFRSVEGSTLDGDGVRLLWNSADMVHNSLMSAATVHSRAFGMLCEMQRAISPAVQASGGQSPFGAELFQRTFGNYWGMPDMRQIREGEFQGPPYSVARHFRAARILWASTTPDNYREKLSEVPGLSDDVARTVETLGA